MSHDHQVARRPLRRAGRAPARCAGADLGRRGDQLPRASADGRDACCRARRAPARGPPGRAARQEVARGDRPDPGLPARPAAVPAALDRARASDTLAKLFAQAGASQVVSPHGPRSDERGEPARARRRDARPDDSGASEWPPPGGADDVTFMLTTSGSTGLPKIVPLRGARRRRVHRLGGRAVRDPAGHGGRQLRAAELRPVPARHLDDAQARRLRGAGRPGPRHPGRVPGRPRQRQRGQRRSRPCRCSTAC